jgi:hypothetical protein
MARIYTLPHRRPSTHLSTFAVAPQLGAHQRGMHPSLGVEAITREWGLF